METVLVVALPIAAVFGVLFWFQIFLITMIKSKRLEHQTRLSVSIKNATLMTILIIGIVYIALYVLFTQFIK